MEIRLLELFGGIGSQTQALKNIGIEHKATLCEIDNYAVETYKQLHGEVENLGDITKVNPDNLVEGQWNLITYSFPCQSVSIAGKQEGLSKDSGTTSSLLWECEKIIRKVKPKYLLMENVANLLSEKFMPEFEKWLKTLKELGYTNYYQILNAKDYGIPQNRERVFCVSILGEHSYYQFPQPIQLEKKLKDLLEDTVDKKYYLSEDIQNRFVYKPVGENVVGTTAPISRTIGQRDLCYGENGIIGTLQASDYKQPKQIAIEQVGTLDRKGFEHDNRVYSSTGLSPTLTTNHQPKIIEEPKIKRIGGMYGQTTRWGVYDKDGIAPTITASMGMSGGHIPMVKQERLTKQAYETLKENDCKDGDIINPFNKKVVSNGICPTITTRPEGLKTANLVVEHNFKIRKLTPRECFRLMGWTDEQFDRIKGISNAQLYKQAGNSIVVNVLEAIFRQLFLVDSGLPQKIEYTQEEMF